MARGRDADTPTNIPPKGWKDITLRVKEELASDHVTLIAAGVAFYALLAIFPAITALMALAGLVLEPAEVTAQLESLSKIIPKEAAQIILDQAVAVAGSAQGGLGVAFVIGLLLAIYSASKGVGSLIEGLNVAYDEDETRGFIKKTLWTLSLTVFLIIGLLRGLLAALAVPAALDFIASRLAGNNLGTVTVGVPGAYDGIWSRRALSLRPVARRPGMGVAYAGSDCGLCNLDYSFGRLLDLRQQFWKL